MECEVAGVTPTRSEPAECIVFSPITYNLPGIFYEIEDYFRYPIRVMISVRVRVRIRVRGLLLVPN